MTQNTDQNVSTLSFGAFELDTRAGELRKGGVRLRLQPQPLRMLALLASRPGELVPRHDVRRELWGDDTFVDVAQGLGACISRIRVALCDAGRNPRYIETLPRRGYRFLAAVEGLPPPRKLILAVLPFDNLSDDHRQDYFCEGLVEEIVAEAASLAPQTLGVLSRRSTVGYKGSARDIRSIGRDLRVDIMLAGSVRRHGMQVRIAAQLVRTDDAIHLWAKTYQGSGLNVLTLQAEMARQIAEAIGLELAAQRSAAPPSHPISRRTAISPLSASSAR